MPSWQQPIARRLRRLIHQTSPGMTETVKWNSPMFTLNGRLVCFFWSAKGWVKLGFLNGALMRDKYRLFNSGKDNLGSRSILITPEMKLDNRKLANYFRQAVQLVLSGTKQPRPRRRTAQSMPSDLRHQLTRRGLMKSFHHRPPYQQRDYLSWLAQAKRDQTRLKRLEQILQELASGDQYMGRPYTARGKR